MRECRHRNSWNYECEECEEDYRLRDLDRDEEEWWLTSEFEPTDKEAERHGDRN